MFRRTRRSPEAFARAQHVLLDEATLGALAAHLLVAQVAQAPCHDAQDLDVVLRRLRGAAVAVPDDGVRRVEPRDGDGVAGINDVDDAMFSAAALLCANGAGDPARLAEAIWNYNHSDAYVAKVLSVAASYGVITFDGLLLAASPNDILTNPRITLTANARGDVQAGRVEQRRFPDHHFRGAGDCQCSGVRAEGARQTRCRFGR